MKFSQLKNLRIGKTWLVLCAAIGIGLLAAWGASNYLQSRVADLEIQVRKKSVHVVVAKADMPKGTLLSSANVAVRPIPGDFTHSQAVLPEQFERLEGQALAYNVKAGEMILWGLLESKRVPTFSARVEEGRRAVTVPVDEINSISGLLEPGDLIDLMVTLDEKGKKRTLSLLQGVQVMATGQRSADDPKSGERRLYSTVTLDTNPQQAQAVVMAREIGRLTALLRNPEDRGVMPGATADFATLMRAVDTASGSWTDASRNVPVLYGGRAGSLAQQDLQMAGAARAQALAVASPSGDRLDKTSALPGQLPLFSPAVSPQSSAASGAVAPPAEKPTSTSLYPASR